MSLISRIYKYYLYFGTLLKFSKARSDILSFLVFSFTFAAVTRLGAQNFGNGTLD